jgi:putative ABC transport system permease protein
MRNVLLDLRHGIRILIKSPGLAVLSLVALGLGIGANTAIFSVANAVLLRPLPYRDSDRLVMIWDQLSKLGLNQFPATFAHYFDYRAQNQVFEDIAAFNYGDFNLAGTAGNTRHPERLSGMRVTGNLFPLLGAEASLGRRFVPEENQPGRDGVVVLSDALWQRRFGGDRNVTGKTITLDGALFTVAGVMPPGFEINIRTTTAVDLWLPIAVRPDPSRTAGTLQLLARLKPGVSLAQASANMKTVAAALEREYHPYRGPHGEDAGYGVTVIPLRDQLFGGMRQGLQVLLGAVGLVLIIACANVANLLLAKAAARRKEIAIRQVLGAGRPRLLLQMLMESMPLALLSGCLGLILAYWTIDILVALSPGDLSHVRIGIDGRVLGFTLLLSLGTGLFFGLAPAAPGPGLGLNESLKEAGRGSSAGSYRSRLRRGLMVAEVALSLVLAIGAGLLIKSFARLQHVNPGFNPERLLTAQISLPESKYREKHVVAGFYGKLLERMRVVPGITPASISSRLPLTGGRGGDPFSIEGRPYDPASRTPQVVNYQVIGPDYFRTMQIPLLAGRGFADQDIDGTAPVAIVNDTMARGFWSNQNPIGKRIMLGAPRPGAPWLTIVGVVGDVRNSGLDVAPLPQMYASYQQNPVRSMAVLMRSSSETNAWSTLRNQVLAIDPDQPVYGFRSMEQQLSASVARPRFQTWLLGIFAGLAVVLAAIGIYGVTAHSVAQRTHEIGIRMALGAKPRQVLRQVVGEAMAMILTGTVLGLAATFAMTRVLSSLLYQVSATDSATFGATTLLLATIGLLASYFPARKATRIDPLVALRHE